MKITYINIFNMMKLKEGVGGMSVMLNFSYIQPVSRIFSTQCLTQLKLLAPATEQISCI